MPSACDGLDDDQDLQGLPDLLCTPKASPRDKTYCSGVYILTDGGCSSSFAERSMRLAFIIPNLPLMAHRLSGRDARGKRIERIKRIFCCVNPFDPLDPCAIMIIWNVFAAKHVRRDFFWIPSFVAFVPFVVSYFYVHPILFWVLGQNYPNNGTMKPRLHRRFRPYGPSGRAGMEQWSSEAIEPVPWVKKQLHAFLH